MGVESIIISADIYPTESNEELFVKGDVASLFGEELLNLLNNAAARIFNLEGPFTDEVTPIAKSGPNLIAKAASFEGIKKLKPSIVSLANNHVLDQGEKGLESTVELCKLNRINYIGVSCSKFNMVKYHVLEINGKRIAVYSCAEHEFSIVSDGCHGANPYDPLVCFDEIIELKKTCDYVFVLYHGGREEYRYPTPEIRKVFQKFAQSGADLVINQHTHCIGCIEKYDGSYLVYGQGNFLFDAADNEFWRTGMLLKVVLDTSLRVEYIPVVKKENKVRLASGDAANEIFMALEKRSQEILEPHFVEETYMRYVQKMMGYYLVNLKGRNLFWRVANKISKGRIWGYVYSNSKYYALLNAIRCESHRELILYGLEHWEKIV